MIWQKRDIEPARSELVEGWLAAMFAERLADVVEWLHAALDTERACPTLYLYGARGTGKTLLARGLARVWAPGEPSDVIDFFNVSIPLANPVCLGEVPQDSEVAEHDGLGTRPGIGARLVLVHHTKRQLVLPEHWLVMYVRENAWRFLEGVSRERLEPLVSGDEIAAHVRWLAEQPRPCPFCLAVPPTVRVFERQWRYKEFIVGVATEIRSRASVECGRCGAAGPVAEGTTEVQACDIALAGWNRRRYRVAAAR